VENAVSANILVTGGAGYIGSVLVPVLLNAGHSVTVIDNFMYNENSLADVCANPRFSVVRGDVRVDDIVRPLASKADVIIPLAALVGAPICDRDPVTATGVNHDAISTMLRYLSREQRILLPITNSGYGIGESGVYCTEKTPMRPISRYGRDKVAIEKEALDRGNAISFRLATVFGASPRMRIDLLVNDFTYRAITDRVLVLFEAHFKRNYIHIRDVARVFMHGIDNFSSMKNEPYNVGLSDANLSKRELAERIRKYVPQCTVIEADIGEDPDKRDYIVSNEKIESTGFRPAYSLDDGIRELVKLYTTIRNSRFSNV
jgi:nucleoside-diphosphate-sugar epimerase